MKEERVIMGDCLEVMKTLEENSVDAIVTDPPYGLSFMGKKWDYDVPSVEIWKECLRVLKPGGYLLSFAGTRTQHRMAVRIEDAGFEIRDMIAWVYGSGFPKSLNIGKAVDKLQGNEREVVGTKMSMQPPEGELKTKFGFNTKFEPAEIDLTKGSSPYEGWGTALKPALEPITVARKPLSEKTVAENVLKWGTGGIDIDGSRVGTEDNLNGGAYSAGENDAMWSKQSGGGGFTKKPGEYKQPQGRFPANLIHDGSDEVLEVFPNDSARFFYCAKASKSERNRGCEGLEEKERPDTDYNMDTSSVKAPHKHKPQRNNHPTVKPVALMEYLVKLVSREGAVVLDPFAGSGSTLLACKNLNRKYIGIETSPEYIDIIKARLK